jgi:hypothetical protein
MPTDVLIGLARLDEAELSFIYDEIAKGDRGPLSAVRDKIAKHRSSQPAVMPDKELEFTPPEISALENLVHEHLAHHAQYTMNERGSKRDMAILCYQLWGKILLASQTKLNMVGPKAKKN